MSDWNGGLARQLSGRYGGMAWHQYLGTCFGRGQAKTPRGWAAKEKEAPRGGSGKLNSGTSSSRYAFMWAVFLIIAVSVLSLLKSVHITQQFPMRAAVNKASKSDVLTSVGGRFYKWNLPIHFNFNNNETVKVRSPSVLLSPHPCDGFTLPPPPTDKKRTGPRPCPVCYLKESLAIAQMPEEQRYISPVLQHLSYVSDPLAAEPRVEGAPGSPFGGYPSLEERAESFNVRESMQVHCGFAKGEVPGVGTGYDIDKDDREAMYACHGVVVASAIFGNYDQLQQPKNISKQARKSVCFFMFVDEETETSFDEYDTFQDTKIVGLWRIVVVHNLPYSDARRNGKVPKLLLHRLFPNARFSLWVDGKLELVQDPYKILERFLWRSNDTFAISQHYKRFDVFLEAEANKAAAKYDNASIDAQVTFYRAEGLTPYTSAKLPITSDVPEGCVIIREHTPIANLMSCLWFNEVDRFTPRDQLSFGIVRNKLTAKVPWRVNMFMDCERRNFVVQAYHRGLLEQRLALEHAQKELEEVQNEVVDVPIPKKSLLPVVQPKKSLLPRRSRSSSKHRKEVQGRRPGNRKVNHVSHFPYGS